MQKIKKFLKDEEGVTAIEYALIAAVIALGLLATLQSVRTAIMSVFNNIAGQLQSQ